MVQHTHGWRMKIFLLWMATACLTQVVAAQSSMKDSYRGEVKTGIEVLKDDNFNLLRGKRVGLITNPTGVDARLKSTIDLLYEATGVKLVALFGPEHGVRGDHAAGNIVESHTDPLTKLPVYSLYGKTRKPTPEMLKGIDVLVYDIQDIGCRSYTYISTMGLAMEAAAEQHIAFMVLDRPNPLGGLRVEGNLVEKEFESFVSQYPIPYVYGLTCGELAKMLNEEAMLNHGVKCTLTVVPMQGWKREMTFAETGLQWVPTSPHIPSGDSPQYYVSTGILGTLGVISEGVGYTIPFRTFAAEWIDAELFARMLDSLKLEGVLFRPITFEPFYGKYSEKRLSGVQLHIVDYTRVNLMSLQFLLMQAHHRMYPNKNPFLLAEPARLREFDKVVGTDQIRKLFAKRILFEDIKGYLQKSIEAFKKRSSKYYLY
jgi:uncharacterized protein YbbC (DUF1343 family)